MGLPNPSRKTKFSGANAEREIFIFPVQLTTCRIGNLTRLSHTLAIRVTIHTVYVHASILSVSHMSSCHHVHYIPIVGVGKQRRTLIDPW